MPPFIDELESLRTQLGELRFENQSLRMELSAIRTQALKDNIRAETADRYEQWLLDIGRVIGCGHLDEQLPNCIIRALQGDD